MLTYNRTARIRVKLLVPFNPAVSAFVVMVAECTIIYRTLTGRGTHVN